MAWSDGWPGTDVGVRRASSLAVGRWPGWRVSSRRRLPFEERRCNQYTGIALMSWRQTIMHGEAVALPLWGNQKVVS